MRTRAAIAEGRRHETVLDVTVPATSDKLDNVASAVAARDRGETAESEEDVIARCCLLLMICNTAQKMTWPAHGAHHRHSLVTMTFQILRRQCDNFGGFLGRRHDVPSVAAWVVPPI